MNRTRLNPISKKRQAQFPMYRTLIKVLRKLCNNKSELSGKSGDWANGYIVEPHHIGGRNGYLYLDPFNIIMITRPEHDVEEDKIKGKKVGKEKLLAIVKKIRINQGFKPNN